MGPPTELLLALKDSFHIDQFVETGTYLGDTSAWAANHFKSVISIEFAKPLYEDALKRFHNNSNVRLIYGHSGEKLTELLPEIQQTSIFWLDSHWSGGLTYGETDECPLLGELKAFIPSKLPHFLFIDDARLFLSTPPQPHNPAAWPSTMEIIDAIHKLHIPYKFFVIEDTMMVIPLDADKLVTKYCQDVNTREWKSMASNEHAIGEGISLIKRGLKKTVKGLYLKANG
jgi:hypothetical protein